MEQIVERLRSLDDLELRTELSKHGEKTGPITPTTRRVIEKRLARRIFGMEHPGYDVDEDSATAKRDSPTITSDIKLEAFETQSTAFCQGRSLGDQRQISAESQTQPACFYVVSSVPSNEKETGVKSQMFKEKTEALAFMKKSIGSRLNIFHTESAAIQFCSRTLQEDRDSTKLKSDEVKAFSQTLDVEKSLFRGPKIQELVQFRKLIEKGDIDNIRATLWSNPRYLISGADTPVILHEGMRYNALHIAAKANQAEVANIILDTIHNEEFTKLLYSNSYDTEESRHRRISFLVDLYLNSPDKGAGESPLHIACKMGHSAVVRVLVMYSATDCQMLNKFGEKPEDIICSRSSTATSSLVKEEIRELLQGLCLVPLLRSQDNVTTPVVGQPCSPKDRVPLGLHAYHPIFSVAPPATEPHLSVYAYAGPMSPTKAQDFHKHWTNSRCLRKSLGQAEISARRTDAEKGYERIGRKLARDLQVPWTEYWPFLGIFANLSSQDGLQKLELHLKKQKAFTMLLAAMSNADNADSEFKASETESSSDSSEHFYSCDEEVENENVKHSLLDQSKKTYTTRSCVNQKLARKDLKEEVYYEVFEDSLGPNDFVDKNQGNKYGFGQRLQIKKSCQLSDNQKENKNSKIEKCMKNSSRELERSVQNGSQAWFYRDGLSSTEEEQVFSEASQASDEGSSEFSCLSLVGDERKSSKDDESNNAKSSGDSMYKHERENNGHVDKSFNTKMTELAQGLESKLVFSPDGKTVNLNRGILSVDVCVCLPQKVLSKVHHGSLTGKAPLDILIKSSQKESGFLADVIIYPDPSSLEDSDDSFADMKTSLEDVQMSLQNIYLDVKVIVKSTAAFKDLCSLTCPTYITVEVLTEDDTRAGEHPLHTTARIARKKKDKRFQRKACYIYGFQPSKTDLDVLRAIDCKVDEKMFPNVHLWLHIVTSSQQTASQSWPSPAQLKHKQRLSDLQQITGRSPLPVSPLIERGLITSTPLSAIRINRDLSPEQLDRKSLSRNLFADLAT